MSDSPKDKVIEIQTKGGAKPWLPAHEAITWFRNDYPGAQSRISTTIEDIENKIIIAEVYIANEQGVMVLVSTARVMGGEGKSLERLETGAIRRALAYLGYGTVAAMAYDADTHAGMDPESEARVAVAVQNSDTDKVRKDLGGGGKQRKMGDAPTISPFADFGNAFDLEYVRTTVSERFNADKHMDNALAKMVKDGDLYPGMTEDEVIKVIYAKYPAKKVAS